MAIKENKKNVVIRATDVVKKFGKVVANDGISFEVKKGEKIGLIGANGAGKTTFVEQLIGTSNPTSGTIEYLFDYDSTPQEKMGMQFQESSYPPGLKVKDIINFSLRVYGSEIDQKQVNELLKVFRMDDFYELPAKGLSGGQQQKLNVLLAIAHKPEIVILDEISTGLDIAARDEIVSYVEKFISDNKTTTFLISHHMSEIEKICDRVIILEHGKVLYDMPVKDVKKKHKSLDALMKKVLAKDRKAVNNDN